MRARISLSDDARKSSVRLSHCFITVERGSEVTEAENQTRRSHRQGTTEDRRSSMGVPSTRNLRRLVTICGFLLRRLNDSDQPSDNYGYNSLDLVTEVVLSGSEDESADFRRSMSHHDHSRSYNHRPTDVSNTNHTHTHRQTPSELFTRIGDERVLVTIAPYGWRTEIRRESATEYIVRYENAAGVRSGSLHVNRRDARRLVAEQCREAVWIELRDTERHDEETGGESQ